MIPKYGSEARQMVIEKNENKHDGVVVIVLLLLLLLRPNHIVPAVAVKQHVIRVVLHHRHCCKNSSVVTPPPLTTSSRTKTKGEPKSKWVGLKFVLFPEILLHVFLTPHLPQIPKHFRITLFFPLSLPSKPSHTSFLFLLFLALPINDNANDQSNFCLQLV